VSDRLVSLSVDALHQRLQVVAPALLDEVPVASVGELLSLLADAVAADLTPAKVWILATAVAGGYPSAGEVDAVRRGLELASPGARSGACLAGIAVTAAAVRSATVTAELVESAVLVDVDFCARNRHNTGIQRVVRNTVKHWDPERAVLASWSGDGTGYRRLTPAQNSLVVAWSSTLEVAEEPESDVLLIPVGTSVLLPEVPAHRYIDRLVAIAQHSGNRTGLIGYDAIPLVSADFVSEDESDRFAHYLTIVKHSTVVSGISETTADEFRSFNAALAAQGLEGPRVEALLLPTVGPVATAPAPQPRALPLVLMVGSIEPRKNQLGVLAAATSLWQKGLAFELFIIGSGGAGQVNELDAAIQVARRQGWAVSHGRGVPDDVLAAAYRDARVLVFPSLQEGYGLPVAEALASGIPVITSRFGSTAEIAAFGGCVLIDPRDDDDIARALESVLVDDALHARLVAETSQLSSAGWPDYAAALWKQLVSA
jgi:glycosyltransferase involved in cell wall biosynthesis